MSCVSCDCAADQSPVAAASTRRACVAESSVPPNAAIIDGVSWAHDLDGAMYIIDWNVVCLCRTPSVPSKLNAQHQTRHVMATDRFLISDVHSAAPAWRGLRSRAAATSAMSPQLQLN